MALVVCQSSLESKVAEWVKTCIDRRRDLAASTLRRYWQLLKWQIEPHTLGRMRVLQVHQKQVEEWIDDLIVQTDQVKGEPLDPYTIRDAFILLRMAFNMAIPKLITINPCKGVKLPQPDDEEISPLTTGEVDTLLGCVGQHRNAALYHVAIRLGLRRGELLGLRWKDIDLAKRTLTVAGQLRDKERARTNRTRRKGSRRTLKIESDDLVDVLHWHLKNQTQERGGSEDWNEADLVFCSENGTAISPRNLDRQFKALLKRAGLRDVRFHDLRHTYATLSIAAGVDLFTLSRRMGHSSIVVTADRYGHMISS